jgi:hypothetical protein
MLGALAVGVVTLAGVAPVAAGAGTLPRPLQAPLTIEKEVDGHVPDGTEFTVRVECDGAIIHTSNAPVSSTSVDFDNEGDPDGSNTIGFDAPGTCSVTETHDGDAEDVSYECQGQFPEVINPSDGDGFVGAQADQVGDPCGGVTGPQEKPITVYIEDGRQYATVTVTNEFPDKPEEPVTPAAQPVTVAPTFTG